MVAVLWAGVEAWEVLRLEQGLGELKAFFSMLRRCKQGIPSLGNSHVRGFALLSGYRGHAPVFRMSMLAVLRGASTLCAAVPP